MNNNNEITNRGDVINGSEVEEGGVGGEEGEGGFHDAAYQAGEPVVGIAASRH